MIYDITRIVNAQTAVWPGDTPFSLEAKLRIADGANINLYTLHTTAHIGTHADAGYHVQDEGPRAHELPLEPYIGPAQVISLPGARGGITPDQVTGMVETPVERLLVHTWVSESPEGEFPADFPYPTPELIDWLADRGAVLFGIDGPSVDAFDSKTLPGHRRLLARGMVHLENLALAGVPDGHYELVALPLKLQDACASPVRAILRA
ncbi:MAG: cyclase family protein [Anaerolineales bacterium]